MVCRLLLLGLLLTVGCGGPDRSDPPAPTGEQSLPDTAAVNQRAHREHEDRLDRLLRGHGPLRLTRREMSLLVDSVEAGPYAGLYGVHGPGVLTSVDLNGDRRPDRVFYSVHTTGTAGAAYVQQSEGGYKLVGVVDLGNGFAVCPGAAGATIHVASLVGWNEGGALVNRFGRGYGARLQVTSDTVAVEEVYEMDAGAYLSELSEQERSAVWARLDRYWSLATERRAGCLTAEEFDG